MPLAIAPMVMMAATPMLIPKMVSEVRIFRLSKFLVNNVSSLQLPVTIEED
jgi:hypothetical protein